MKKLEIGKLEKINGGLSHSYCLLTGAAAASSVLLGAAGIAFGYFSGLYSDVGACWNS